jgi:hypothetical protein
LTPPKRARSRSTSDRSGKDPKRPPSGRDDAGSSRGGKAARTGGRPASGADRTLIAQGWSPFFLVTAVALAASISGIANGFVMDDLQIILTNPRVHDFPDLGAIFSEPYWPEPFSPDMYRPLTTASFALQWIMGGGSPVVFRIFSYAM